MSLTLQSSCLHLSRAGIAGTHIQLQTMILETFYCYSKALWRVGTYLQKFGKHLNCHCSLLITLIVLIKYLYLKNKKNHGYFACIMSVYPKWAQCLQRPKEGVRSPENGATGNCELLCERWKSNPSPLEEQAVSTLD